MQVAPHFIVLRKVACAAIVLIAGCGDVSVDPDAAAIDARPNTGTFSLAWSISDGTDVLGCDEVGAFSVSIRLVKVGGFAGTAEAFGCEGGQATSRGIEPGIYQFTVDLRASGARSLLSNSIVIPNIEITANGNTELPEQVFAVNPEGNFSFFVDGNAAGGNCESVANGGAGIVGVEFALRTDQGVCVPAVFVVSDGSEPGGTFTSSCDSPTASMPCIGDDQQVSVTARSGSYQVVVLAQKPGPIQCYSRVAGFSLPGAGLETELGSLNLALEYSEACDPNFMFPDAGVSADAGIADAGVDASI